MNLRILVPLLLLAAHAGLTGCGPPSTAAPPPPVSAPESPPRLALSEPAALPGPAPEAAEPAPPGPAAERRADTRPAAAGPPAAAARAAVARQTDWPQFRGPDGMGVSPDRGVPVSWSATEGVAWKTELPGGGTSSPIVYGDRVYLTCYGGTSDQPTRRLVSLDRATGKILWNKETTGAGPEEARIRENHGWASSTPATDGERIYAFFGRGGVYGFDMKGRQLWRAAVGDRAHGWGSAASPVVHGELLIVNASVESESLVALDRKTGKEAWRANGVKEAWNTPVLVDVPGGKRELVVPIFRKVLAFDPQSGQELWSCDTQIDWYMVPSVVARDGIVYCIGGRTGGALAVRAGGRGDVTATHRVWSGTRGSNVSSPVLHEGHLYWAKDSPAAAYCAETKTGRVVYEERLDAAGQVYASPVLADGRLYYVGRNGKTYVLPAAPKFEVLAMNEIEQRGVFNASPAVAGSRLFIRSDRFLYCIGK